MKAIDTCTATCSARSIARSPVAGAEVDDAELLRLPLTDVGNAQRMLTRFGQNIRFVAKLGWYIWDGRRWLPDETFRVPALAQETVRLIEEEARHAAGKVERDNHLKWLMTSDNEPPVRRMLEMLKPLPSIAISADDLDADPMLLNVVNGTIDLKTGKLREHRREDLITKIAGAAYDPQAPTPVWSGFLKRIFRSHPDLIDYMRRVAGYAATGSVREQCLFVWYGLGANGKSTFADAISCALGDYAGLAPPDLLIASGNGRHPTEMADLLGRRFVSCSESGEGRRFDEARVKMLTGEQRVKARVMRGDFFEFDASHKLILMTNHKPEVHGTDHGIWRRIKLIPFIETISAEERDADLPQRLAAERDGILPWIVRGAQEWLAGGLKDPAVVHRATAQYRAAEDVVGRFLQEETATRDGSVECQLLYDHYVKWCQAKGERSVPYKQLRTLLEERGIESGSHPKTRRAIWKNLSVPSLEVTGS